MKRIILIALLLFVGRESAWAGTCEQNIGNAFTPNQQIALCKAFGSSIASSLVPKANNTYDLGSASLAWRTAYLATSLKLTGTSAKIIPGPTSMVFRNAADSSTNWTWADAGGLTQNTGSAISLAGELTSTSNIILSTSGGSLSIQENSASTACMGTAVANGTTPVVVTTSCAASGARVIYSRNGAVTNVGTITTTTAPNGTSFSFASTGAADIAGASVVWLIIKESA